MEDLGFKSKLKHNRSPNKHFYISKYINRRKYGKGRFNVRDLDHNGDFIGGREFGHSFDEYGDIVERKFYNYKQFKKSIDSLNYLWYINKGRW